MSPHLHISLHDTKQVKQRYGKIIYRGQGEGVTIFNNYLIKQGVKNISAGQFIPVCSTIKLWMNYSWIHAGPMCSCSQVFFVDTVFQAVWNTT